MGNKEALTQKLYKFSLTCLKREALPSGRFSIIKKRGRPDWVELPLQGNGITASSLPYLYKVEYLVFCLRKYFYARLWFKGHAYFETSLGVAQFRKFRVTEFSCTK